MLISDTPTTNAEITYEYHAEMAHETLESAERAAKKDQKIAPTVSIYAEREQG